MQTFLFTAALLVSHQDKLEVERVLSSELLKISSWLIDNRLSLHLGKTESILFACRTKLKKSPGFRVVVGDVEVATKDSIKYLGCTLDNNLSGESMALQVIQKVNQRGKFLARTSSFLNRSALEILAGALIQCHFDYASTSWYTGISAALKHKLQTAQNKLVRVILKLHPRTHLSSAHFDSLKWLRVEDRASLMKLTMVHRIQSKDAPKYLHDYFIKVGNTHGHFTRQSTTDLMPMHSSSSVGRNTFRCSAASKWNGLPKNLKTISSATGFKVSLKLWLNRNWT